MYPYHFTYLKKNEQGPSTVEPTFETDYFPICDRGIEFMQYEVLGPAQKSEETEDENGVQRSEGAKGTENTEKSKALHPIDLFCNCPEKPQVFYMYLVAEDPERAVLQHENMLPDPLDDIYNRL